MVPASDQVRSARFTTGAAYTRDGAWCTRRVVHSAPYGPGMGSLLRPFRRGIEWHVPRNDGPRSVATTENKTMTRIIDTTPLPPHAHVVARDDVWMEGDAVKQFARIAELPGCIGAAAMPDLHA